MNMHELAKKVELGLSRHSLPFGTAGKCIGCPYLHDNHCSNLLSSDALKVVRYWKGKYESTLLATPTMILHTNPEPSIVKNDSSDIQKAEKYTKAMKKAGNAAKFATEALRETTQALRELKEELKND